MKRDFLKIYVDSQPLSQQAVDALRRYHEAMAASFQQRRSSVCGLKLRPFFRPYLITI